MDMSMDMSMEGEGGFVPAPAIANQSVSSGRLSLINGDFLSVSNGAITNTSGPVSSITLGTRTVGSDHWESNGVGLRNKAVPSDVQYVWTGCTADGPGGTSPTFTLTINTEADTYYCATDETKIDAALDAIGVAAGDRTIKIRNGPFTPLTGTFRNRNQPSPTNRVTITAATPMSGDVWSVLALGQVDFRNSDMITLSHVEVANLGQTGGNCITIRDTSDSIIIDTCKVRGDFRDPNADYSPAGSYVNVGIGIGTDGTAAASNITIRNCLVTDCNSGIGLRPGVSVTVEDNELVRLYLDAINIDCTEASLRSGTTLIQRNVVSQSIGDPADDDNPHTDVIQLKGPAGALSWTGVTVEQNMYFHGDARGDDVQGIAWFTAAGTVQDLVSPVVRYNVMLVDSAHGISMVDSQTPQIIGNVCVHSDPAAVESFTVGVNLGTIGSDGALIGVATLTDNIVEASSNSGGSLSKTNHFDIGKQGATTPYTDLFEGDGSGGFDPQTYAEALQYFETVTGETAGAIKDGVTTWGNPRSSGVGWSIPAFVTDQFNIGSVQNLNIGSAQR